MSVEVFIYLKGLTNHVAWRINGDYVSFHPGAKLTDLGSRRLPLPGGAMNVHAWGTVPAYETIQQDQTRYGIVSPIVLTGLDGNTGAQMAGEFRLEGVPYILWDPACIGSINCVTLSIVLLNVMLPERLPQVWDDKWGGFFRKIREHGATGGDWLETVFQSPSPDLMHVSQVGDLAADWVNAQGATASTSSLPRLKKPPLLSPSVL